MGRRLTPGGYLGLHVTLGLLLSGAALAVFGGVAEDVTGKEDLTVFDVALANALHARATTWGVTIFKLITELGSVAAMAVVGAVVGAILVWRGKRLLLAGWLLAFAGGGVLDIGLKLIFHRPRPQFAVPFMTESSWSFPSGHALGSLIGYGMLAYLLLLLIKRRPLRLFVIGGLAALVLLIGFSRLYLGVHYFSDVIAGYAAGATWLAACISGVEVVCRGELGSGRQQPPGREKHSVRKTISAQRRA